MKKHRDHREQNRKAIFDSVISVVTQLVCSQYVMYNTI